MLIEFSIENFKVFKQKASLSMVANKPYKEHPASTMVNDHFSDITLTKSAIIYGANGAGKSSLIEALHFFLGQITQGFISKTQTINYAPFLFDNDSATGATSFEIIFIGENNIKYHYGLSLNSERVLHEFLLSFAKKGVRAKTVFSRIYDPTNNHYEYFYPALNENKKTIDIVVGKIENNPATTLLGALNQYESVQIKPVINWLQSSLVVLPFNRTSMILGGLKSELITMLSDKKIGHNHKTEIIDFLNHFDLAISDIKIFKKDLNLPKDLLPEIRNKIQAEMGYDILVYHQTATGDAYPVKYDELSSGSKKLFDLSGFLHSCCNAGKHTVLIFDEFESSFHPYIVKKLYELLVKNPDSKVQLIVTTHSPTLLEPTIIRRDQIWFVEKNTDLESLLYSLVDFSPSLNDSIAKGWMQGRYGAVPYIDWGQQA